MMVSCKIIPVRREGHHEEDKMKATEEFVSL
jgi:hypothetical protein